MTGDNRLRKFLRCSVACGLAAGVVMSAAPGAFSAAPGAFSVAPDDVWVQAAAKKKDYSQYSTTRHNWYIVRNRDHKKVHGGVPSGWKFSDYDAYYMNTKTRKKVIYLTFDCGYENGYTKKVLKTLKKHNAKALFFVTEAYIREAPDLIKKMKKQGHLVGNHTCHHPNITTISTERLKEEIKGCAKTMKEKTGYRMDPFFRPPEGSFNEKSLRVIQDLGYRTMFWSMAYHDYDTDDQPGKDYVIRHFKENVHPGAMPLIHIISSSNCAALDTVLTDLEDKGYRFGSADEFTMPKGKLVISCEDKVYDGKKAKIKVVKNTNKKGKLTVTIYNAKGKKVKKAVRPGKYSARAVVSATWKYRTTKSKKITFWIRPKKSPVENTTVPGNAAIEDGAPAASADLQGQQPLSQTGQ